jgi:predicted secreted protein
MFEDARSKTLVFVAHCFLNQNSISDGTADYPALFREVVDVLVENNVGIVQMPCPETICLGLDRGDPAGSSRPVIEENTRIRAQLETDAAASTIKRLVDHVVFQAVEYRKHGFDVKGVIGVNRSPSCGVDTTSKDNREVPGRGVFMATLWDELVKNGIDLKFIGVKTSDPEEAARKVEVLTGG